MFACQESVGVVVWPSAPHPTTISYLALSIRATFDSNSPFYSLMIAKK